MSKLVSSDSSFKVDVYYKLEGGDTVSGINYGKIYGPEGEWLVSTYRSG